MLSILGKIFSRRHFEIFFFFTFPRKQDMTFHANCLPGDNLHEMSKPVFWEKIKKVSSVCHLLKMPREW